MPGLLARAAPLGCFSAELAPAAIEGSPMGFMDHIYFGNILTVTTYVTRDEETVRDLSGHTGFGIVCRLCSTCHGSLGASLAARFFPRGSPLESKSRFLNPELPQVQVPNLFSIQACHKFRDALMHLPLGSHGKTHFSRDAWDMLREAIGPEPLGATSGWLEQKLVTGIHEYVSNA